MTTALQYIRTIYISLAAIIGLVVFIIGSVGLIDLTLENFVFPVDRQYYYTSPLNDDCKYTFDRTSGERVENSPEAQEECKKAREQQREIEAKNSFNSQIKNSLAMLIVGLPVWLFHFLILQSDWRKFQKK